MTASNLWSNDLLCSFSDGKNVESMPSWNVLAIILQRQLNYEQIKSNRIKFITLFK